MPIIRGKGQSFMQYFQKITKTITSPKYWWKHTIIGSKERAMKQARAFGIKKKVVVERKRFRIGIQWGIERVPKTAPEPQVKIVEQQEYIDPLIIDFSEYQ